ISVNLTATDNGAGTSVPGVNGWSTSGDTHTATISYPGDALYTFDIAYTDLAGNTAADYAEDSFYVDNTDPVVEFTSIEDNSANGDVVQPVITGTDTNFSELKYTLTGANRGLVNPIGSLANITNGKSFSFRDFIREPDIDDIYTLSATATDMAGRSTTKQISFSVNRFGSIYALDDSTKDLNGTFTQEEKDVVIKEVNSNELSNIKITLFKNNETITLKEGRDYKISVTGGNGQWYEYIYTILKSNFADDGVYKVTVYSEDAAGNVAENTLDTKTTDVNFGIDKTAPSINIKNIKNGITYAVDSLDVTLSAADNLKLTKVVVMLDGKEAASWTGDTLDTFINSGEDFTFNVNGDSTEAHTVKVIATDAAGNVYEEDVSDFYVTTNLWVRYYNNKPLFFGSIAGVLVAAGLIIFLVVFKRRKNEEKENSKK
ncbi:MAG: hypothetical protein ACI4F7_00250, partial [Acutalibacteraceae bacterium]